MGNIIKFRNSSTYKKNNKKSNDKKSQVLEFEKMNKDGFTEETNIMDTGTTGCLFVNDYEQKKQRLIIINAIFKNSKKEYRHFILHKEKGQPIYAHCDTYHGTGTIELEADYFARRLLMPLSQSEFYCELLNKMENNGEQFTIELLIKYDYKYPSK